MKSSWDGEYSINVVQIDRGTNSRDPAAIRKIFDFSHLSGKALLKATKSRILTGTQIVADEDRIGIEIGNFVLSTKDGKRIFGCTRYEKVNLIFEAEGFASGGERPKMKVLAGCLVGENINRIAPIWIPVGDLVAEDASEGSFDFPAEGITVEFESVFDQWPQRWELVEIQLVSEVPGMADMLRVGHAELRASHGGPLSIKFENFY